jgi:putative spermidine/putrescine transport system ATP-binding protein
MTTAKDMSQRDTSADVAQASMGATVTLRRLTKRFGNVLAVDDVNLSIHSGEFLTVLGPSGSGKTTILRLLAGFETPTKGSIELNGEDVAWMPPAARNIGMVFQHYALFPHMSVGENIAYGLKMRGWSKEQRQRRTDEMLRLVRLEGMGSRSPKQLSGGQQQRVALARALAFGPHVLLMDEPLGALDKALRLEMGEEIRRIHRETRATVIYVTHDQEEALALSDRVAIMRNGNLVANGTPQELYRNPPSRFVATFFGGCNIFPIIDVSTHDGSLIVRATGGEARIVSQPDWEETPEVLAVHPHNLRVSWSNDVASNVGFVLSGHVREVLFMGDSTQITCHVEEGPTVVVRERARRAAQLEPGTRVNLIASEDDLIFIPGES